MAFNSNMLTPASPVRAHKMLRAAFSGQPKSLSDKGATVGSGTAMDNSRAIASLITNQTNAIIFGKGKNLNIFT